MAINPNLAGMPPVQVPFIDNAGVLTQPWRTWFQIVGTKVAVTTGGFVIPTGTILPYSGPVAPIGFLICDGSEVSRTAYATLFGIIGVTWGIGDGSTTFNLPSLGDRFLTGAGASYAVGDMGGANNVTIDVTNLPSHFHTITDPGHNHTIPVGGSGGAGALTSTGTNGVTGTSTTGITQTDATGDGDPLDVTPLFASVNYIIAT